MPGPQINSLLAIMRNQAQGAVERVLKPKIGYVTSFDPKNYSVRVRLEPESTANELTGKKKVVETNWMPLARPYGGKDWGFNAPPNADPNPPYGDMVLILWPDGGQGMALGPFYNVHESVSQAEDLRTGEFEFRTKDGAYIQLRNDGSVRLSSKTFDFIFLNGDTSIDIVSNNGAAIRITSGGNITLTSAGGATINMSGTNVNIN